MATTDMYVEFVSSDIKGDVRDKEHGSNSPSGTNSKPTVEVTSFTHTIAQPRSSSATSAGGHANARAEHGDLIFTKQVDAATPKMLQACSAGTVFKDVKIYFYRAVSSSAGNAGAIGGGSQRKRYMLIELKNVLISQITSTVGSDGFPIDTFALRYGAIKTTYDELRIDGTAGHSAITGAWSLVTNTTTFA